MKNTKKSSKKKAAKPSRRNASIPRGISGDEIERARKLYKAFAWGADPKNVKVGELNVPIKGEVLVELGELAAVEYYSMKSGKKERYKHSFKSPRPKLVSNAAGNQVHVIGGGYKVKQEGIVG